MIKNASPLVFYTDRPDRSGWEQMLAAVGFERAVVTTEAATLSELIDREQPGAVVLCLSHPSKDTLARLIRATRPFEHCVVVFVRQAGEEMTRMAVARGVTGFVVDGFRADRLVGVVTTARARFEQLHQLRHDLDDTKRALEERKVIERAKGVLMTARGMTEEEAYRLLRKTAMDQNTRLGAVAAELVKAAALLS